MNLVGSGFYVGLVCDMGCKGTNQKIVMVASSSKLSLAKSTTNCARTGC